MYVSYTICVSYYDKCYIKYYSNKSYKGIIFNITNDKNKI